MFIRKIIIFISSAAIACHCLTLPSSADTLDNLGDSPVLKKMEQRSKKDRVRLNKYSKDLPKNREYSRIFVKTGGPKLINYWLGVKNPKFRLHSEEKCLKQEKTARCSLEYFGSDEKKIHVTILVPNPNFLTLAEFGYVNEIAELQPPHLEVKKKEEIKFKGFKTYYFETPDDFCSYLIFINMQSVVHGRTNCSIKEELDSVLNDLDIARLNDRLVQ